MFGFNVIDKIFFIRFTNTNLPRTTRLRKSYHLTKRFFLQGPSCLGFRWRTDISAPFAFILVTAQSLRDYSHIVHGFAYSDLRNFDNLLISFNHLPDKMYSRILLSLFNFKSLSANYPLFDSFLHPTHSSTDFPIDFYRLLPYLLFTDTVTLYCISLFHLIIMYFFSGLSSID